MRICSECSSPLIGVSGSHLVCGREWGCGPMIDGQLTPKERRVVTAWYALGARKVRGVGRPGFYRFSEDGPIYKLTRSLTRLDQILKCILKEGQKIGIYADVVCVLSQIEGEVMRSGAT